MLLSLLLQHICLFAFTSRIVIVKHIGRISYVQFTKLKTSVLRDCNCFFFVVFVKNTFRYFSSFFCN